MSQFLCPNGEDYSPCKCHYNKNAYILHCRVAHIKHVKETFQFLTSADFHYIYLSPAPGDGHFNIPRDIFMNHRATNITIGCYAKKQSTFEIHTEAFRASQDVIKNFKLEACKIGTLNLSFLANFHRLEKFSITNSENVHFTNLPSLPSLTTLTIEFCTWIFNKWIRFPPMTNYLESFSLLYNQLNDSQTSKILDWVLDNSSNGTVITHLDLGVNMLTRIPKQITSFPRLSYLTLRDQKAPGLEVLLQSSLSFQLSVKILDLASANIKIIEQGTFQGKLIQHQMKKENEKENILNELFPYIFRRLQ